MEQKKAAILSSRARSLRKAMTPEERHLWYDFLKQLPVTVHRQRVIDSYIVDFYIAATKTVIELDGSQHYQPSHQATDIRRDEVLHSLGITVLRYSNQEINCSFPSVCADILNRTGLTMDF